MGGRARAAPARVPPGRVLSGRVLSGLVLPGAVVLVVALLGGCVAPGPAPASTAAPGTTPSAVLPSTVLSSTGPTSGVPAPAGSALAAVGTLRVAGRGPRTGYARAQFGPAWADVDRNGCDTRDDVLRRDLRDVTYRAGTHDCVVLSGRLDEPYTGRAVAFTKSDATAVQIDHVVALSDAWQKGAAQWTAQQRLAFANDPLGLLAVDGPTNQAKGDGDTATWLPPARPYRCRYVARQVAVKARYALAVTPAERDAMVRVLGGCPREPLPAG